MFDFVTAATNVTQYKELLLNIIMRHYEVIKNYYET